MQKTSKIRLYITSGLSKDIFTDLPKDNAHYLFNVMRKKAGDNILLFNGKDGEWIGRIDSINKKNCSIQILSQTKIQKPEQDIWLCFAPVKNAPMNNMVQKVTELGVSLLQPVFTKNTISSRINTNRMKANAIEAAEQSERLTVPEVNEAVKLDQLLNDWDNTRTLIICDESGGGLPISKALLNKKKGKYAILIGPEGGFSQTEFEILYKRPYIIPVGIGPRILRADTAAIAALTCYQNILGDWNELPHFTKQI